jgi:DNA polymerase-3 subunit delta
MIYLFYGPDEFGSSEAVHALLNSMPPDVADFNVARLDGKKLKLDDLARACEAAPFLADKRLVIVTDALKHLKAGKERDAFRTYLKQVPPTCDLVFVERGDVDKRNVVFTHIKQAGQAQEFRPRQGADLLRWLGDRARHMQVRLDREAAQHLIDYVGNDSRTLVTELDKLATYAGPKGSITSDSITLLVQDSQEHNLFAFIDNLSRRHPGDALRELRGLLDDGQAATYILFMLMRQVRILLGVQELAARRMRADEIAAQIGQKPFVVRKALEQVRGFHRDELRTLHDRLLETDRAIKTGRVQAEVALEVLVMEVCGVMPTG